VKGVPGFLLLIVTTLTGCSTFAGIALPAPTPPPARSIAVASLPPTAPRPSSPPAAPSPARSGRPPLVVPPAAIPRPPPVPAAKPPASPPPSPPAPPRVLSTGVEDEQRVRREAQTRIEGAERLIQDIDPTRLAERRQEENLLTIQNFLDKAREALSARDVQRAFTLADKALLLADELSRALSSR
jgi:hypothetical protein